MKKGKRVFTAKRKNKCLSYDPKGEPKNNRGVNAPASKKVGLDANRLAAHMTEDEHHSQSTYEAKVG